MVIHRGHAILVGRDTGQPEAADAAAAVWTSYAYALVDGAEDCEPGLCLSMLLLPSCAISQTSCAPQNPHMPILPQSNLHLDILMGRDETLEPADFMMQGTFLHLLGRISIVYLYAYLRVRVLQPRR